MEKLFIIWAKCGKCTSAGDGVLVGEEVGAESHSSSHGLELGHVRQSVFRFKELSGMEGLEDARVRLSIRFGDDPRRP